jgi:hypothetical protein
MPFVIGLAALIVLVVAYRVIGGTWNVAKLYEGADGRASASKLQWFLWTVTVLYSYVVIFAARAMHGSYEPISDIPANVLLAMGFSATTMATAKGITASYVLNGKIQKPTASVDGNTETANKSNMFLDESGFPELSKIQMLVWTAIAVVIYLFSTYNAVRHDQTTALPDIDGALMVLMGLGQGAYLGKKLTTSDQARLTGLSTGGGACGEEVTINGESFGDSQSGSLVTFNGKPIPTDASLTWTDTSVSFKIPGRIPGFAELPASGAAVAIGLIVGGRASANTLPFTVMSGP